MHAKRGPEIVDGNEVLLRHIFPSWLTEEGEPSSQAFYPWRDIDAGCLSVDRRALVTPADAFARFTSAKPQGFGQPACEVWGLSVEETRQFELTSWQDPVEAADDHPANPTHARVDFNGRSRGQWGKIGKKLKVFAITRKRLHP